MLAVDIKMNDKRQIGRLEAQRLNDVYVSEVQTKKRIPCRYQIWYKRCDTGEVIEFEMEHDYQDKAELLVAKALKEVKRRMDEIARGRRQAATAPRLHRGIAGSSPAARTRARGESVSRHNGIVK